MKFALAIILAIASIAEACTNCAPKNDDKVNLTECNHFPGRSNWFSCHEGKVASIVHKEPDGVTEIVIIAEAGRPIWIHEKASIEGDLIKYSINDDDQDDGIVARTTNGIITYIETW